MKERSVSERRAGWSFGRTMSLFGLSALDWDLIGNIPLGFRQILNLELEMAASHGPTPATGALTRKSTRHLEDMRAKTPPSIQLIRARRPSRCGQQVNYCFSLWGQKGGRSPQVARCYLWSARAPLPCFQLSCLGGTPLPLRMKLSIDKVQRGEKPPPAAKSGGEGLPAGGPWLMLPLGRLGGTPAMPGPCFGHSDCNRRAPSHAVMYHYNFECDVAAPLFFSL